MLINILRIWQVNVFIWIVNLLFVQWRIDDFALFYNEELEIAPGPTQTLQGPIFSNKNIYLMTDRDQILTLRTPKNLGANPQDYILHSAGNIYSGFKRVLAENYLLKNPTYFANVPVYYKKPADVIKVKPCCRLIKNIECPPRIAA